MTSIKRPKSAYMYFITEHKSEIIRANPTASQSEILKIFHKEFEALDPIQKNKYMTKANKSMVQYREKSKGKKMTFRNKKGQISYTILTQ